MGSKRTLTGHPETDEATGEQKASVEPPKVKLPPPGTKPRLPLEKKSVSQVLAPKMPSVAPLITRPPKKADKPKASADATEKGTGAAAAATATATATADALAAGDAPAADVTAVDGAPLDMPTPAPADSDPLVVKEDGEPRLDESVEEISMVELTDDSTPGVEDNEVIARVERELAAPPRLLGGTQTGLPPPAPPPELAVVQPQPDDGRPGTETNVLMPQAPDRKKQIMIIAGAVLGGILLIVIIAATMNSGVPDQFKNATAGLALGSGSGSASARDDDPAGGSGADKAAADKTAADKAAADKAAEDKAAADKAAADKAAADKAAADKAAADKAAADKAAGATKAPQPAPGTALTAVLAQARFFIEKRKCRDALETLKKGQDEGSGQWQLTMGRALVCRRRYKRALAAFTKAVQLDANAAQDPALIADLSRIATRRRLQLAVAQLLVHKIGRPGLSLLVAGASHRDNRIRQMCIDKVTELGAASQIKWATTLAWDLRQMRSCEQRRQAVLRVRLKRDRRLYAVLRRARNWRNACAYREIEAALAVASGRAPQLRR